MARKSPGSGGRFHFIMINIVRVLLVVTFFTALSNERWLVLYVSALAFFVTLLPIFLEKGWGVRIPAEFEITMLLFIYGTLFFGEVRGFYARFWWWDILLNLASAIALGLLSINLVTNPLMTFLFPLLR